jgi:hypothetical protein
MTMQFLRKLAVAGAVLLALALPVIAANLPQFTGVSGSNPVLGIPANQPDLNTIVNGVNANASFAGTGTPSLAIGAVSTTTNTMAAGTNTNVLLEILASVTTTTSTGGAGGCRIAAATGCFYVLDSNGNLRAIPFN